MSELHVTAVIVTYKSALLTIGCLDSLHAECSASRDLSVRAIVVDNSSEDLPVIAQAVAAKNWSAWVTLVAAPTNGGFAYGNNLGVARACADARPDYVYLLNPDTQVRPGAIGSLVHCLETHPNVGIAGSSFENSDGSDWPWAFRFPSIFSELAAGLEAGFATRLLRRWVTAQRMSRSAQPVDWICGASMMIRPAVFSAIRGFDENYFLYFEETDFCKRAQQAGFPTWYVPESRVMHIGGQSTGVTDLSDRPKRPKRLPAYWFESRRRYFAVTFGVHSALAIDVVSVVACSLGLLKRFTLRRMHSAVPYYIRDLVRHSVLWPRNRVFPPVKCDLRFG
jgi:N-acetylglucosaminyl-diphospho-decaprenol L-rhamnosyltransferase